MDPSNLDWLVRSHNHGLVTLNDEHHVAFEGSTLPDRVNLLVRARLDIDPRQVGVQQPPEVGDHFLLHLLSLMEHLRAAGESPSDVS